MTTGSYSWLVIKRLPRLGLLNKKHKIGVLLFMERKLIEAIRNECKIESANGIPSWLQLPAKDLIEKRTIGEGSFGTVYEGSWLGHRVAIKDIHIDARDLFDMETAVLAKLESPFIVQLIGTCIEESHCYIVMKLVSSNLDKLLTHSNLIINQFQCNHRIFT
ncbi:hypothetical protein SUGI_0994800 [Cryptomeria japonica]|nr:hypothetical protein SUGI_0994800 [Cryptomeria japonica]